jgi:inner membrane protein
VEFKTQASTYTASNYESGEEDSGNRRTMDLSPSTFGVNFFYPVDNYQTTTRSAKYGELFLALTFLIFFLFEILSGARIHAFQYLLVGFALILFYLLLLSTSEFIGFGWSYLVAAVATIGLITAYSSSVLWNWKQARMIGVLLAFIYAYLYCLLKAEDYSLLLGSIGLFVSLAVVMYATRKVDWYNASPKSPIKLKK